MEGAKHRRSASRRRMSERNGAGGGGPSKCPGAGNRSRPRRSPSDPYPPPRAQTSDIGFPTLPAPAFPDGAPPHLPTPSLPHRTAHRHRTLRYRSACDRFCGSVFPLPMEDSVEAEPGGHGTEIGEDWIGSSQATGNPESSFGPCPARSAGTAAIHGPSRWGPGVSACRPSRRLEIEGSAGIGRPLLVGPKSPYPPFSPAPLVPSNAAIFFLSRPPVNRGNVVPPGAGVPWTGIGFGRANPSSASAVSRDDARQRREGA